ncbi:MAG: DNA polymerase III subunit epsilon [Pseudomonadota bacterium]|nr:DNA polymerase III subunit epsilon [Pseudomonadota bacterium]
MREIIFDTETTGLRAEDGDRVIELGAVELENRFPTGRHFHTFINPEGKRVDPGAYDVHGLSDEFLADKPSFSEIVGDFLDFVSDANLVAHNAGFDMGFINAELRRLGMEPIPRERVIDTLAIARKRHPMGPNSLDALCQRYSIDNSRRDKHGALLDSELLAEVYIELNGGRQASLVLDAQGDGEAEEALADGTAGERRRRPAPLPSRLDAGDLERHVAFVETLGEAAIWKRYG